MEQRCGKLMVSSAGGTAGHGAKTYKVTLPTTWVQQMELQAKAGELLFSFDGEVIRIQKQLSPAAFAEKQHKLGHTIRQLCYYDDEQLCTTIYADFTEQIIRVENHTQNLVKTAFGRKTLPDWTDFQNFLEERCVPRQRAGLRQYLEAIGLEEYEPLEIIQKTAGRMAEDQQWLEVKEWPFIL